nr:reverse transcriptase domain-containing protein [Tanacetum cinerariifolium]
MVDNRTMAELLRAPTEGYAEAIVVPPILAEQFKLKHILINMMTTDQFFRLKKDNPHDHIRCLRNEISNFQQKFDESFHEAWDRYKYLLCACPHYGFTDLHQLNTFYNALNPADQDSLNAAASGNLLERTTPPPASVKAVEEICVTCGGSGSFPSNTVANPKGKLKTIINRNGLVTNGPTFPTPPKSITPEVDERVEETYMDPDLAEYTIKFTFPADFVIVDYESDPRVPLILGRPFLWTARALIDVHGEEIILHDGDERLTLNMKHDTSSYSNKPQRESVNLIKIFNVSKGCNVLSKKFLDLNYTKDLHPPLDDNLLSGSTTYSSNSFLEEFTDKLALITYHLEYDDNLQFDIESNLKEIEFLLY